MKYCTRMKFTGTSPQRHGFGARFGACLLVLCTCFPTTAGLANDLTGNSTAVPGLAVAPSPDGASIVISRDERLWRLPLEGGSATPLTPASTNARNPDFSPDGNTIVYQSRTAGQWDLWLLDYTDGSARRITDTPYNEVEPDFWPDGHSVVFASDRADSYDVWELHLSSGALRRLTGRSGRASFPRVSERGEVVYANESGSRWSLYLLRTGVTTLITSRAYPLRAPSWHPDGGVLVVNEQPSADQNHLVMLLLDSNPMFKELTFGEDVGPVPAAWLSPEEYVYAADGLVWRRPFGGSPRRSVPFRSVTP